MMKTLLRRKFCFFLLGLMAAALAVPANASSHRFFDIRQPHTASPLQTLYTFVNGGAYGSSPDGGVVEDRSGVLYGTTSGGGAHGWGTVFTLSPAGAGYIFNSVYNFTNGTDGSDPQGGLLLDSSGAIYGTASRGGAANYGTVFKLTPGPGYIESTLYSFKGGTTDGYYPVAGLVADERGSLYGTTSYDGAVGVCPGPGFVPNCGTVFRLTPTQAGYRERILHTFTNQNGDGADPWDRLLLSKGILYGTTEGGGSQGAGTVFMTDRDSGATTILCSFGVSEEGGSYPFAALSAGPNDTLLGTTTQGGITQNGMFGWGMVFSLANQGLGYTDTPLYSLATPYATGPYTNVVRRFGTIYGTTFGGGTGPCRDLIGYVVGCGSVFALKPAAGGGYAAHVLYSFQNSATDGANPYGDIIIDDQRAMLFGTTLAGGADGLGSVYAVKL